MGIAVLFFLRRREMRMKHYNANTCTRANFYIYIKYEKFMVIKILVKLIHDFFLEIKL